MVTSSQSALKVDNPIRMGTYYALGYFTVFPSFKYRLHLVALDCIENTAKAYTSPPHSVSTLANLE
jgi:hypothetical protein